MLDCMGGGVVDMNNGRELSPSVHQEMVMILVGEEVGALPDIYGVADESLRVDLSGAACELACGLSGNGTVEAVDHLV